MLHSGQYTQSYASFPLQFEELKLTSLPANSVAWVASNVEGSYKRSVTLGMAIGFGNLNGAVTATVVSRGYRSLDPSSDNIRHIVPCPMSTLVPSRPRDNPGIYRVRVGMFHCFCCFAEKGERTAGPSGEGRGDCRSGEQMGQRDQRNIRECGRRTTSQRGRMEWIYIHPVADS